MGQRLPKYYFSQQVIIQLASGQKVLLASCFTTLARGCIRGKYVNFMAKIDFSNTKNEGYSVVNRLVAYIII